MKNYSLRVLFLLFVVICSLVDNVNGGLCTLNDSTVEELCAVYCSFGNPMIWSGGIVPQSGDDILYFANYLNILIILNTPLSITPIKHTFVCNVIY